MKMKNQMLSAVDPSLHNELRNLFSQYPFAEMSAAYARENGCAGITFEDGSIYILPSDDAEELLMIYLHESAHCALLRHGAPGWHLHNDYFVRQCRELQARFGVTGGAWHSYDQQDAHVKTSKADSVRRAACVAHAVDYDPTQRAAMHAAEAVGAERRHLFRYATVVGGSCVALIVGISLPFGACFNAIDGDTMKLAAGAALVNWIWFSMRG